MISEIFILFFKASLTIRHTATVSQKKSGTSKKIQWDFQISRVGSLDFLDLKVNGSPVNVISNRYLDLPERLKLAEIPPKYRNDQSNNRETLIGALIYIFNSAFLYRSSGHYRKWTLQNKNLKSLFQNYK